MGCGFSLWPHCRAKRSLHFRVIYVCDFLYNYVAETGKMGGQWKFFSICMPEVDP